jgi:hypothetical protein
MWGFLPRLACSPQDGTMGHAALSVAVITVASLASFSVHSASVGNSLRRRLSTSPFGVRSGDSRTDSFDAFWPSAAGEPCECGGKPISRLLPTLRLGWTTTGQTKSPRRR